MNKEHKFKVKDHVRHTKSSDFRNHYVIAAVLEPGHELKDSHKYPGCSIKDYVNQSRETEYICPDAMSGITFAFKESELELLTYSRRLKRRGFSGG